MTQAPGIDRLYLVGLMGAGKSTVGKLLARKLEWTFIDLDQEIETHTGNRIQEIFDTQGEAYFRDLETLVLRKTLNTKSAVIACGGGIVIREKNRELLQSEMTIWLNLSPEVAAKRLSASDDRPLLKEGEDTKHTLTAILAQREQAYAAVARLEIDSDHLTPPGIAEQLLKEIQTA